MIDIKGEWLNVVGLDKELLEIPYLLLFLGFLTLSPVPFIPISLCRQTLHNENVPKKGEESSEVGTKKFLLLLSFYCARESWRRRKKEIKQAGKTKIREMLRNFNHVIRTHGGKRETNKKN